MLQLLDEFEALRKRNITRFGELNLSDEQLERTGIHPAFGAVRLSELLATWMVHDLDHLAQIARVMAKQYQAATGPWTAYLGYFNEPDVNTMILLLFEITFPMAKNKTEPTQASVERFIQTFANSEQKKKDSYELIDLMKKVSGHEPKMWPQYHRVWLVSLQICERA